ncbi:hypothetical protein HETIRDRAFT_388899 [Heterobasidion irregulare TC 32-1]|uniref:Uncharacterized protein n=1 Tax=Heterobasidion irregulare (strain TC 32-1) TaxID=747525 RepID=W4JUX8_HETIT|nr:uncharacterized protein HETIRDRAFT_388899 [Heterobasidion irregulare TC 32-1]ETW77363.1 hypothetical protein HETIRDRAFT_388899 [Heterobasidion irregulare TC 32-1]
MMADFSSVFLIVPPFWTSTRVVHASFYVHGSLDAPGCAWNTNQIEGSSFQCLQMHADNFDLLALFRLMGLSGCVNDNGPLPWTRCLSRCLSRCLHAVGHPVI